MVTILKKAFRENKTLLDMIDCTRWSILRNALQALQEPKDRLFGKPAVSKADQLSADFHNLPNFELKVQSRVKESEYNWIENNFKIWLQYQNENEF